MNKVSSRHGVTDGTEQIHTLENTFRSAELAITNIGATEPLYFRVDGEAVTVAGDDSLIVPAGASREVKNCRSTQEVTEVRVIGVAGSAYSVELTVEDNR